jgi:hypothetical protein
VGAAPRETTDMLARPATWRGTGGGPAVADERVTIDFLATSVDNDLDLTGAAVEGVGEEGWLPAKVGGGSVGLLFTALLERRADFAAAVCVTEDGLGTGVLATGTAAGCLRAAAALVVAVVDFEGAEVDGDGLEVVDDPRTLFAAVVADGGAAARAAGAEELATDGRPAGTLFAGGGADLDAVEARTPDLAAPLVVRVLASAVTDAFAFKNSIAEEAGAASVSSVATFTSVPESSPRVCADAMVAASSGFSWSSSSLGSTVCVPLVLIASASPPAAVAEVASPLRFGGERAVSAIGASLGGTPLVSAQGLKEKKEKE